VKPLCDDGNPRNRYWLAWFPPSLKQSATDAHSGEAALNPVREFSQNARRIPTFPVSRVTESGVWPKSHFGIKFL